MPMQDQLPKKALKSITRRDALRACALGGSLIALHQVVRAGSYLPQLNPTPSEIKGPFYPFIAQKDKDFDLTQIAGRPAAAQGKAILIDGEIVDTDGQAVREATVEIWQAAASGKYNHPYDTNPAPADPNFQGWALVPSGEQGNFRFKTVMPGAYPAAQVGRGRRISILRWPSSATWS